jgi:hypothetical protein
VPIDPDNYFIYGFDKQPKLGMAIMRMEIFSRDGKRDTSFVVRGDADMPSMRGAHSSGDKDFSELISYLSGSSCQGIGKSDSPSLRKERRCSVAHTCSISNWISMFAFAALFLGSAQVYGYNHLLYFEAQGKIGDNPPGISGKDNIMDLHFKINHYAALRCIQFVP